MNESSQKKYDYFICYCGKDLNIKEGTGSGPNWDFALALFEYLEGFGKKVYFAPKVGQGDTFKDTSFLKNLINEVEAFIVLFSPSFFRDFSPENETRQIDRSAIQMEMQAAIEHVRFCGRSEKYLRYILLPGFAWCNLYRFCMRECFDLSEAEDTKYIDISAYDNSTMIENEPKSAAKQFLKDFLGVDIDRNDKIAIYGHEVERCFHSMMEHMGRDDYFGMDTGSVKLLKTLGIATESNGRSPNWPVFFSEVTSPYGNEKKDVSTCAMCFGVLQILHWCENDRGDRKIWSTEMQEYYQGTDDYFKRICKDALIRIVLLRVNGNHTEERWPATKNFETGNWDGGEDEDNGLNQTTLSAATLLKSGFLRNTSVYWGSPNDEELAQRYSFLSESVAWVLGQKRRRKEDDSDRCYCSWGTKDIEDSTFLTAVSLDLLLKFAEDAYAKQHKGEAYCNAIKTIPEILTYFEMASDGNGVVSTLGGAESFSHTAKVMNTLCTLCAVGEQLSLSFRERGVDEGDLVSRAKKVIDKCFRYLVKELDSETKIYEKKKHLHGDDFFINYKIEYYELNGELLAVTAMTKLLDGAAWHSDIACEDGGALITKLVEFFEGYRGWNGRVKHYFDWTASESVLIRGRRTSVAEQYPIYALYYYRMALVELLNLLEKRNKSSFEATGELREAS